MSRRSLLSLAIVPFAVACGAADSVEITGEGPSTLTGKVALTSYVLDNPVVIARTTRGTSFVAPVQRDGSFKLVLPTTEHYRVLLASTLRNGSFRAVSEIRWGAEKAAWGSFTKAGSTLDVGLVHPLGTRGVAVKSSGSGSDGSRSGGGGDDKSSSSSSSETETETESETTDCYKAGRADLPYNWNLSVGRTVKLVDAFLEKGAPPKAIVSVTMEGTPWHLTELQTGAPITVTQADCDHEGNHGTGRDRIVLTWENADGSKETDHMTIRWCKGGGGGGSGGSSSSSTSSASTGECKGGETTTCGDDSTGKSECDGGSMKPEDGGSDALPSCPPGTSSGDPTNGSTPPAGSSTGGADGAVPGGAGGGAATGGGAPSAPADSLPAGGGRAGGACVTSADCGPNLACFASVCTTTLR